MTKVSWPAWFYGPNNQAGVFASESLVPKGWQDHPSKVEGEKIKPTGRSAPAPFEFTGIELDADGWPFDPSMHAATKTKTKAGLWRMKVGVTRPEPKPPLDL